MLYLWTVKKIKLLTSKSHQVGSFLLRRVTHSSLNCDIPPYRTYKRYEMSIYLRSFFSQVLAVRGRDNTRSMLGIKQRRGLYTHFMTTAYESSCMYKQPCNAGRGGFYFWLSLPSLTLSSRVFRQGTTAVLTADTEFHLKFNSPIIPWRLGRFYALYIMIREGRFKGDKLLRERMHPAGLVIICF